MDNSIFASPGRSFSSSVIKNDSKNLENDLMNELMTLKKQLNQQENEFKKENAVAQQKIQLLNLHLEEYQKREVNLKKLNDTIMESLNGLSSQGNSKIIKELQLHQEQHNKDLIEGKQRSQQANVILEKENRELKDELNNIQLKYKDLEMALEKERVSNRKIQDQVDRSQVEIEYHKNKIMIEEQLLLQKQEQEKKINEITTSNQQNLEKTRVSYEEKIKSLYANFDKEKQSLEQRIQKNLNTIKKYQSHIESSQNVTLNSTFVQGQSKGDISQIIRQSEIEIELKGEISRMTNEVSKQSIEISQLQELLSIKDEKISFLQVKNLDQEKIIDELKKKQQNMKNSSENQRKSSIQSQLPLPTSAQRTPAQFDSNSDYEKESRLKNQRSQSINIINHSQQQIKNIDSNGFQQQPHHQLSQKFEQQLTREQMNRSQVQQRISNLQSFIQDKPEFETTQMNNSHQSIRRNMMPDQFNGQSTIGDQESDTLENLTITHECGSGPSYFTTPISTDMDSHQDIKPSQEQIENINKLNSFNRYNQQQQQNPKHSQPQQQQIMTNPNFFKENNFEEHQTIQNGFNIGNENDRYEYIGSLNQIDWNQATFPHQQNLHSQKNILYHPQGTSSDPLSKQIKQQQMNNENIQQPRNMQQQRMDPNFKNTFSSHQSQVMSQGYVQNNGQYVLSPMKGERTLHNITNQSLSKSISTNNTGMNYKTLILCESCGQCFIPNELVDHMAVCDPQLAGICISERREGNEEIQIDSFNSVINQLNYEKQVVEQKLLILENHLKNGSNSTGAVAQDRDRLKLELDSIMAVLGKARMNQTIKSEEQEACTVALKNEITFLIKKLLKAKGSLQEDCSSLQKNSENLSYISSNLHEQQSSPYSMKQKPRNQISSGSAQKGQSRRENSSFSQKGNIDGNSYTNVSSSLQSQCQILDASYLRESYKKNSTNDYPALQRSNQQFYSKKGSAQKPTNYQTNQNSQLSYF